MYHHKIIFLVNSGVSGIYDQVCTLEKNFIITVKILFVINLTYKITLVIIGANPWQVKNTYISASKYVNVELMLWLTL